MRTGSDVGVRKLLGVALCLGLGVPSLRADDWPQWLGLRRDGVWRESGILEKFPPEGPKIRWRTPIGAGYAGPAVAGGKVFVTDRILGDNARLPGSPFDRGHAIPGKERVLCLDERSGQVQWKHEHDCPYQVSYASGPRTTPVVSGGKVYTLGTMGDLLCLAADSGDVVWSKNLPREYKVKVPVWGFSASPLVDGDKLITLVGGEGSVVVALNKDTGKEMWRALSAREPGYCPPMIYEFGGKRQLIVWDPEAVHGLDPETGKVYWSRKFEVKAGMTIPTPRQEGEKLFVSCFYNGSMLLEIAPDGAGEKLLWKGKSNSELPQRTDKLHCVMSTPVIKDGYIYGVCSYGDLRCLKLDTGERVWQTREPTTRGPEVRWANAFLVENGDRYFLFNEVGDLIIAKLSPQGYEEISRAHILDATNTMAGVMREVQKDVVWSHPAFADKAMFARNDKEIVCVELATAAP